MNTEGLKCNRCGAELKVLDEMTDGFEEYYGTSTVLICPNCGATFECLEPSEERKSEYDFYKDGEPIDGRLDEPDLANGHCINCGHVVSMSNNFMLSDYDEEITNPDDDKMNFVLNECPYCGMNETRWDTAENEKKDFPYWEDDNKLKELLKGYDLYYVIHFWAKSNDKIKDFPFENQEVADELRKLAKMYDEKTK